MFVLDCGRCQAKPNTLLEGQSVPMPTVCPVFLEKSGSMSCSNAEEGNADQVISTVLLCAETFITQATGRGDGSSSTGWHDAVPYEGLMDE